MPACDAPGDISSKAAAVLMPPLHVAGEASAGTACTIPIPGVQN